MSPGSPRTNFVLVLYVAGATPASMRAVQQVSALRAEELGGTVELRVVDVLQHPRLASADTVLVTPTLVKRRPRPVQRFVGDDLAERLLGGLLVGSAPAAKKETS
jgi:circadian clock protein KaiB